MRVTVVLPKQLLDPSLVRKEFIDLVQNSSSVSLPTIIRVHRPRVLWRALGPCLLLSDKRTARCLLSIIFQSTDWSDVVRDARRSLSILMEEENVHVGSANRKAKQGGMMLHRRNLRVDMSYDTGATISKLPPPNSIILWIEPSTIFPFENAFMGRLIAWEHKLIRAQSLTGYIATLGGGFFLCHHFQTAVLLSHQQQRMALLLNDQAMYYKCILNSAYSCIYAGNFSVANKLINQVLKQAKECLPSDPVLIPMCYSARLFCQRMKRATEKRVSTETLALDDKSSAVSRTVDDLARVRIARDKSRKDDLFIPFRTHSFVR
jgi:hypothetical protein